MHTLTSNQKYKNVCDGHTPISEQWLSLGREKEKHFSGGGDGLNINYNTLKKPKQIYGSMVLDTWVNLMLFFIIFLCICNTSKSTI